VTTAGWIGLITTVAIFIGSIVRSGDLHYRGLEVVDQVDGSVVARTEVIGIYSPKSDDYQLKPAHAGWWEPITTDQYGYSRGMMRTVPFRQDGSANLPEEMRIDVWNLRFLSGETIEKDEPAIAATLNQLPNPSLPLHLTGSITNLGDSPLQHAWLRMYSANTDLSAQPNWPAGGIAPKASWSFDLSTPYNYDQSSWTPAPTTMRSNGLNGQQSAIMPRDPKAIVRAAGGLSTLRNQRIEQLIGTHQEGMIYALAEDAAAGATTLDNHQAIEKHWRIIRAAVPLRVTGP
jgi:hypothetical protein